MTKKQTAVAETPSFENALSELSRLVESLESGQLSLEASLTAFEQGIKLTRDCQLAITKAEQRVKALLEVDGEAVLVTQDFEER